MQSRHVVLGRPLGRFLIGAWQTFLWTVLSHGRTIVAGMSLLREKWLDIHGFTQLRILSRSVTP